MSAAMDRPKTDWIDICDFNDILPDTGVAALVDGHQIAIFRVVGGAADDTVHAIDNYDPNSSANVISRGLIGDLNGELMVASPVYKNHYSLVTGACLEDPSIVLCTYPARVSNRRVEIQRVR